MATNTYRNADSTITFVVRRRPENIPVPYELRDHFSPDKWDSRIIQIKMLCAKYSKPIFERIWFVLAFLACAIIPVALYHVIFLAITPKSLRDAFDRDRGMSDRPPSNRFDGRAGDQIEKYMFDTRLITFAIFIGLLIVLWTPYFIWKRIGCVRARALTTRWAVEDGRSGASFIPRWTIKTPGVFTDDGVVIVTTPPNAAPTLFAPNAHLPPYILQVGQQAGGMPWTQQPQQWQQPPPVPYNPAGPQTGVPPAPYFPEAGSENNQRENPFSDEKRARDFEEGRV